MANFDSGVSGYIKARCTVEVGFPIDCRGNAEVACKQCPYYVRSTQRCALNQELVHYPDKYIGADCPLEFDTEKENENA